MADDAAAEARALREVYDGMAAALPGILFMNAGLAESGAAAYDWIRPEDRRHRYHLSLVRRAIGDVDLTNRTVLEIGFGRGGNSYYLSRYTNARHIYAVDSSAGNALSAQRIGADRAEFICADAAELPFPNDSFDVVLNVDWSPAYPHPDQLMSEIRRVLRPNGTFVYADIWTEGPEAAISRAKAAVFRDGPFVVRSEEDVSEEVFQALDRDDGLAAIIKEVENESNRPIVDKILHYATAARASLAAGFFTARIIRSVKRV